MSGLRQRFAASTRLYGMRIDADVVDAARSGGDALDALIGRLWPEAYRIAFGIVRDRGLAEDCAQEACASIARRLRSLKDSSAFAAWSYRVVTRRALDATRSRVSFVSLEEASMTPITSDGGDGYDLNEALGRLAPRQRAIILLHYYGGLNSVEIAGAIGVLPVTVRFHLMRARAALRKALTVAGNSESFEETISHVR